MKTLIMKWAAAAAMMVLASQQLLAAELKSGEKDLGKVDMQFKSMHVVGGKNNGYDPNTATAYLVKLKYETPSWKGLNLGLGFYNNGDLFNLTDFNNPNKKVARGLFVDDNGDETSQMGEAYLRYQGNKFSIDGGRRLYSTPLTTITYNLMPNFHSVVGATTTAVPDTEISLAQILQMSFGSRAMTDFGLIGEGTGTAGAAIRPNTIGQAEFHRIGKISLGKDAKNKGTNGITVFGTTYSGFKNVVGFKKIDLSLWNYYSDDISNNLYLQADAVYPVKGLTVKLGAQYLTQRDVGDSKAGDLDFDLYGVKATLAGKGWAVFGAYNHSGGDSGFMNAYGSDPAYTSTIFSRNEYRENVDAYQIGFKYKNLKYQALKPFTVIAKYSYYGESDSVGSVSGVGTGLTAQDDADEFDLIWLYQPPQLKDLTLKLFTAWRTSEYNGSNGKQLKQRHTRLIFDLKF